MPIYEYACDECGENFEVLVSSAKVKSACPKCGAKKISRRFSTFAAHVGSSTPCKSGVCPGGGEPVSGGCGGGKCPFN